MRIEGTIEQQANVYFEGKVTSRTVYLADGERLTLGVMCQGEYQFNTTEKEKMDITAGELIVLLPGETAWQTYTAGESFEVPANSVFQVKAATFADYTCYYL